MYNFLDYSNLPSEIQQLRNPGPKNKQYDEQMHAGAIISAAPQVSF